MLMYQEDIVGLLGLTASFALLFLRFRDISLRIASGALFACTVFAIVCLANPFFSSGIQGVPCTLMSIPIFIGSALRFRLLTSVSGLLVFQGLIALAFALCAWNVYPAIDLSGNHIDLVLIGRNNSPVELIAFDVLFGLSWALPYVIWNAPDNYVYRSPWYRALWSVVSLGLLFIAFLVLFSVEFWHLRFLTKAAKIFVLVTVGPLIVSVSSAYWSARISKVPVVNGTGIVP